MVKKHLFICGFICCAVILQVNIFALPKTNYQYRNGNPLFITHWHVNPRLVKSISRFNSLIGHPYYSGDISNLKCESQKHYFEFTAEAYKAFPSVYAPCSGTIFMVRNEPPRGYQIAIAVDGYTDYHVFLFHIRPLKPFQVGQHFNAGDKLGTHFTMDTMSDVAVQYFNGNVLSSVFEYMTGDVLKQFGLNYDTVSKMIISEALRNQYPSKCKNFRDPMPPYVGPGTPPDNWYVLQNF